MPFGIIGRMGPGMRQVVGFLVIGPREGVLLGTNLRRAIVTKVCDSASTVGAAVWDGACGGSRHCCIRYGSTSCKGTVRFWGFCSPFSQREMPLGLRRWNVSDSYAKTWQHFRSANVSLEGSIRGLFGDVFSFKIKVWSLWEISKKVTIARRQNRRTQQSVAARGGRNMHIHECTPRRSGAPRTGPYGASATHAGCSPRRGRLSQRHGPLPKLLWTDLFHSRLTVQYSVEVKLGLEVRKCQLYWHQSRACNFRTLRCVSLSVSASATERKVASASVRGRSKSSRLWTGPRPHISALRCWQFGLYHSLSVVFNTVMDFKRIFKFIDSVCYK